MRLKLPSIFSRKKTVPVAQQKSIVRTEDGFIDTGWDWGYWQQHRSLEQPATNATVEACIAALSQTAAMCPIEHYEDLDGQGQMRRYGSNLERVMLNPNKYQTRSTWVVDGIRSLYTEGNAYGVAERNDSNTIRAIHWMNPYSTKAYTAPDMEEVFYFASAKHNTPFNMNTDEDRIFPARDVIHLMLKTDTDKLRGISPLYSAAHTISANNSMTRHQASFFNNMSRPSGVLSTEANLNREQMRQLREAWEEQSAGLNSGKLPILSSGLEFKAMSLNSQDSQLVEAFGMTVGDISRAFRVPLVLINDMSGATFNNAEQTMGFFIASGLGYLLDHFELHIAKLFNLPFSESVNFDTNVLMRADFKGRMEGLGIAVEKGIYAPNEARKTEKLPAVDGGDEPRVQKQVVPLSYAEEELELRRQQIENQSEAQDDEEEPEPEVEPETVQESAEDIYDQMRFGYHKAMSNYG